MRRATTEPERELTFWSSTQGPHLLRRRLALATGIPEGRIRVLVPDVGGGFGQKIPMHPEEVAVALAARAIGRPVIWVEDRRENLVAAQQAKEQQLTRSSPSLPTGRSSAFGRASSGTPAPTPTTTRAL